MEFTHYVVHECDAIGFAGETKELDEERVTCLLRLHAIKGVTFVAVIQKKDLRPMEVVR